MKKRPGFTLAELILAVMIFGFMATSLATIYSTSNRHMFQNYRANVIKTNVGIAMRAVQNTLSTSTRLDVPAYGASGNILAFASNVDQVTGCYPVGPGEARWHYFCIAPDANIPAINSLYYHTGTIAGGTGCAVAAPSLWGGGYPAFCGFFGGGTVTLLMQATRPTPTFFSRAAVDGVNERDIVRVRLRSLWSASGRGFGKSQRDVDFTLDSAVQVHRYAW
ncbi:MAG: type II secretion system GspH family protein [Elusimicrobiales bacterium]|nr:type II secretion system GspH family protein [Elusimicrobiales bacterium]